MERFFEIARVAGITAFHAVVHSANEKADRLFRKTGFHMIKRCRNEACRIDLLLEPDAMNMFAIPEFQA